MGCDVLRLGEQRADCTKNRGKKHQAPCQGLKGINPSNLAGDHRGQEAVLRSNNALLIFLSPVHTERKVSLKKKKKKKLQAKSWCLPVPWGILSTICHACALLSVKMTR